MAKTIESPGRPRAVGYCRVSSKRQAEEGGSLKAQREAICVEAVVSGFELVDIFEDAGVSGAKDEGKRPGLSAALSAIREHRASALIVRHIDRLSRETNLAGFLRVQVKRAGGRLVVIGESADPIRLAVDTMLAELERIRGGQRMKTWNAERKAKGFPAGYPAFGMRRAADGRLEADPEAAATVARILALRGEGASLRTIAAALNADRVHGPTSAKWNAETINGVVKRQGGTP